MSGPLAPGNEIAPGYEVIEHLRRGRNLDVYDVWSEERACRCVVKSLRPDRLGREGPTRRLLDEGRLLRELTHPHIVRAYEVREEPVPLFVMETLTGETLGHMIEVREARLSAAEVAHLGLHLASAIRYLHAHGWLHLDLKPSNVVAECGRAKLIDLSVARPPGPAHGGIGTLYYMAPEQVRGGELGPAADVWGIGAVLRPPPASRPSTIRTRTRWTTRQETSRMRRATSPMRRAPCRPSPTTCPPVSASTRPTLPSSRRRPGVPTSCARCRASSPT
jgi:serine/threonine protein kinase